MLPESSEAGGTRSPRLAGTSEPLTGANGCAAFDGGGRLPASGQRSNGRTADRPDASGAAHGRHGLPDRLTGGADGRPLPAHGRTADGLPTISEPSIAGNCRTGAANPARRSGVRCSPRSNGRRIDWRTVAAFRRSLTLAGILARVPAALNGLARARHGGTGANPSGAGRRNGGRLRRVSGEIRRARRERLPR